MTTRADILRWLGLSVSLVATSLSGFSTAFNVYALALKEMFGYTQTQVEIVPSIGTWGLPAAIIQSAITWKFGHNVTYALVWILSPASVALLYIGTVYRDFFHNWPVLIGIFHFIVNASNNMLQVLVCQIGVQNFDKRHVGKLIGVYGACMGFGKIFYAGFFSLFSTNALGQFFLYSGLMWSIMYGLTFLLHRPIRDDEETTPMLKASANVEQTDIHRVSDENGGSSIKDVLRSPYFHAVFWPSTVFYSGYASFMNNITTIAHSADFTNPVVLVYVFAGAMTFGRLVFGNLYDCIKHELFASFLLIMCYSCYMTGLLVAIIWFNKPAMFVTMFLIGISSSGGGVIPLSLLVSRFGRGHYAVMKSISLAMYASFVTLFQIIIGHIYDTESPPTQKEGTWCTGRICFYWSLVMLICLSFLPLIIQLINFLYLLAVSLKRKTSKASDAEN